MSRYGNHRIPAHSNKISHHLAALKQQQQQPGAGPYHAYSGMGSPASTASHLFSHLSPAAAAAMAQQQQQLQQTGPGGSKIFHVDAYCYLCKKEFCNKYFLRTHLANKHKVFLNGADLATLSGASMSKLQNDLLNEQQQHGGMMGGDDEGGSPSSPQMRAAAKKLKQGMFGTL